MAETLWTIRSAVYDHFVETGNAPSPGELQQRTGLMADAICDGLRALADAHHLVLAPATTDIWMAHPFSAVPTEYPVDTAHRRYWANCAWDAFGIPALLDEDAKTATRCAHTGEPVELEVRSGHVQDAPGLVHFLVPARDFWKNVGFT